MYGNMNIKQFLFVQYLRLLFSSTFLKAKYFPQPIVLMFLEFMETMFYTHIKNLSFFCILISFDLEIKMRDQTFQNIHSFSSLSYDRSKASSKASCPHSAIQSFLLQMRVSSPFLNTFRTGLFKLFKRPLPGFLTILTL